MPGEVTPKLGSIAAVKKLKIKAVVSRNQGQQLNKNPQAQTENVGVNQQDNITQAAPTKIKKIIKIGGGAHRRVSSSIIQVTTLDPESNGKQFKQQHQQLNNSANINNQDLKSPVSANFKSEQLSSSFQSTPAKGQQLVPASLKSISKKKVRAVIQQYNQAMTPQQLQQQQLLGQQLQMRVQQEQNYSQQQVPGGNFPFQHQISMFPDFNQTLSNFNQQIQLNQQLLQQQQQQLQQLQQLHQQQTLQQQLTLPLQQHLNYQHQNSGVTKQSSLLSNQLSSRMHSPKKGQKKIQKKVSQQNLDKNQQNEQDDDGQSVFSDEIKSYQNFSRQISNLIQEQYIDLDDSDKIQYYKGEVIGKGAYGQVYQVLDIFTGQLLAVKSIKFNNDPSNKKDMQKELNSIKHEIQMLRTLNHPNIVKYFGTEFSEDFEGVDILLEFVPGGSIKSLLEKFMEFDERLVKIYTRQMLEGLSYLHEKGIIHRDLKCANVLVDNTGTIKLSDFGASKRIIQNFDQNVDGLTKSVVGSPYWMAPEVILGKGYGMSADIWGLGCCVIEMLTAQPPWSEHGKDSKVILTAIKNSKGPPKYPDNISKDCREFLDYCFERDCQKRPTSHELLLHPFVLLKNPAALQESSEAARMIQNHIGSQMSQYQQMNTQIQRQLSIMSGMSQMQNLNSQMGQMYFHQDSNASKNGLMQQQFGQGGLKSAIFRTNTNIQPNNLQTQISQLSNQGQNHQNYLSIAPQMSNLAPSFNNSPYHQSPHQMPNPLQGLNRLTTFVGQLRNQVPQGSPGNEGNLNQLLLNPQKLVREEVAMQNWIRSPTLESTQHQFNKFKAQGQMGAQSKAPPTVNSRSPTNQEQSQNQLAHASQQKSISKPANNQSLKVPQASQNVNNNNQDSSSQNISSNSGSGSQSFGSKSSAGVAEAEATTAGKHRRLGSNNQSRRQE